MSGNTTYFGIQYPSSSDYVKDGATAIQTVATGFDSAVAIPTYNAQTGTTYTFALSDIGKVVTASNAAASTYTIPPQASVVWVASTTLNVTNLGAGIVTFAGGVGVTVTNTTNTLSQYQSAQLIRTGSNAWTVVPSSGLGNAGTVLLNTTTMSAVASQSVNDVFSSAYNNYLIHLNITGSTTLTGVDMRLRVGGVDNSSSNYARSQLLQDSTTVTGSRNTGQTSWTNVTGIVSTERTFTQLTVTQPFATLHSGMIGDVIESINSSVYQKRSAWGTNVTTSYTGFTLIPSTGTMTGTIAVYGYK
jgi:hypothetical protein